MESLLNNQKSLMISSLDKENRARISYAPFIYINNKIYIYISKVADHYNNIEQNGNISIMVIEDEQDAKVAFARNRVSFLGNARKIEDREDILNEFFKKHNKQVMEMLVKLDFNIFEINIENGRLVKGFGKAFDVIVENNNLILKDVIIEKNHK